MAVFCLMWAGYILASLKPSVKAKIQLCGEVGIAGLWLC